MTYLTVFRFSALELCLLVALFGADVGLAPQVTLEAEPVLLGDVAVGAVPVVPVDLGVFFHFSVRRGPGARLG